MKTLFLAWQDQARTRRWFPIGRLDADLARTRFQFEYTRGAQLAHDVAGLEPLDSFPDFHRRYESAELFPLFRNRVLSEDRRDFPDYLARLDLAPGQSDPLAVLALTGGERQTDNLQVFPKIERHEDGGFRSRFFLHGWRHVAESARQRLLSLHVGEELQLAIEFTNPATTLALQVQTSGDYHMIGWAPRYLVTDLLKVILESPDEISAVVVKINPSPAPAQQRVLIEIRGRWPDDYRPMETDEFQPLDPV